jgi:magnesium-transporting ATPase (P-type)
LIRTIQRENALFAGTSIVSGEAIMLVVATGKATHFGGIPQISASDAIARTVNWMRPSENSHIARSASGRFFILEVGWVLQRAGIRGVTR